MKPMSVLPIQTRVFTTAENLADFIVETVPKNLIHDKIVIAITSKIVSLAENRLIAVNSIGKEELVRKESDYFLGEIGFGCYLTVKEGLLIPSAGIDESNSETGSYILYPEDPFQSAEKLWCTLKEKWNLNNLGILLTDSHTTPLRRGVNGICLSYWGFKAVKNMIGTKDIFGRELKMTQINFADALAAAAVLMMGEGKERQPLALIHHPDLEFSDTTNPEELKIPLEEDLYYPLLKPSLTKPTL